jgi:hypothetical protein
MWQILMNKWRTESHKNGENDENMFNHFLWKLLWITSVVVFVILYIVIVHG